jgi:hypothetical protein
VAGDELFQSSPRKHAVQLGAQVPLSWTGRKVTLLLSRAGGSVTPLLRFTGRSVTPRMKGLVAALVQDR